MATLAALRPALWASRQGGSNTRANQCQLSAPSIAPAQLPTPPLRRTCSSMGALSRAPLACDLPPCAPLPERGMPLDTLPPSRRACCVWVGMARCARYCGRKADRSR